MRVVPKLSVLAVFGLLCCARERAVSPDPVSRPAERQSSVPFAGLKPLDPVPLTFPVAPAELTSACEAAQRRADVQLAALIAVPDAQRTFANSFEAFDAVQADFGAATQTLAFLKDVHPDAKVRAAAATCEAESNKYWVRVGARKDLYLALKLYAELGAARDGLSPLELRLVFLTLRDFRRNGLELSDPDRARLVQDRSRIAELSTRFAANLEENQDSFEATPAELAGLPAAYLARLQKGRSGKLVVTMKYPDYFPLMENARREAVRKRAYGIFNAQRATANLPLLAEAVKLREDAAHLLGFSTYADYRTEDRMAKRGATVKAFLGRLRQALVPGRDALDRRMLALKRAQSGKSDDTLQSWDVMYELNQIKQHDHQVDDEVVRGFFPSDKVLSGMFQVFSQVLHVTFQEVPNPSPWAPGVKLYEVHDAPGGRLLARFYLDLYPRPGKFGHAASFPLVQGHNLLGGGYQVPRVALVTNFEPPRAGKPSHLSESETATLFHEFGHVMHECLTTSPYVAMAGTNVDLDFVEAPSQMLESWVYEPEVLKLISDDPAQPGSPMPAALAKSLVAARTFDAGIRFTRQVSLATFDLQLHSGGGAVDPDKLERKLRAEIMGYPVAPSEHSAASFGHLMGGYDAGYYGYLWSQVFAEDMFTRFKREGILNPDTGRAYRDVILASGKTVEARALLERFLGRPPNDKAFLQRMGVTAR